MTWKVGTGIIILSIAVLLAAALLLPQGTCTGIYTGPEALCEIQTSGSCPVGCSWNINPDTEEASCTGTYLPKLSCEGLLETECLQKSECVWEAD